MAGLFYLVLALVALVLAAYVFVSTPAARIVRMGHTITVVALAATALVLFLAGRAGLAMMLATAARPRPVATPLDPPILLRPQGPSRDSTSDRRRSDAARRGRAGLRLKW